MLLLLPPPAVSAACWAVGWHWCAAVHGWLSRVTDCPALCGRLLLVRITRVACCTLLHFHLPFESSDPSPQSRVRQIMGNHHHAHAHTCGSREVCHVAMWQHEQGQGPRTWGFIHSSCELKLPAHNSAGSCDLKPPHLSYTYLPLGAYGRRPPRGRGRPVAPAALLSAPVVSAAAA